MRVHNSTENKTFSIDVIKSELAFLALCNTFIKTKGGKVVKSYQLKITFLKSYSHAFVHFSLDKLQSIHVKYYFNTTGCYLQGNICSFCY